MALKRKAVWVYYLALAFVVIVWGLDPLIMTRMYTYYSASVLTAIGALASLLLFLPLCAKRLKELDRRYFYIAVPISALNSLACLLQKIGLQYTTPANYAFLEHLSCVVVPFGIWLAIKKRPTRIEVFSSLLCLGGCFMLCGADFFGGAHIKGDLLCALAGVLLGICVVAVGVHAQGLDPMLYICVHMSTYLVVSLLSAFSLNAFTVNGVPMEAFRFTFSPLLLLAAVLFGLLSIGVCWLLKNMAIVHVNPTVVAVVCPMSAVIAGGLSVVMGSDRLTPSLLIGGGLILVAILVSGLSEVLIEKGKRDPDLP